MTKPMSELPYTVHTGRELELMLAGTKPLAVFFDQYPDEPCEKIIPENAFRPHVEAGKFEQREFIRFLWRPPGQGMNMSKGFAQCSMQPLRKAGVSMPIST